MFFKKNSVNVRIVKRLQLKRFYFGNHISWEWRRPLFTKAFHLEGRMNPHIAILGESGGGKSNASRLIATELSKKGYNLIILDPNRDYLGIADQIGADVYDAWRHGINLFDPDKMNESEKIGELMAIFVKRLKLGQVQASLLKKCISYCYLNSKRTGVTPSIKGLLNMIRVFQKRDYGGERKTLATLYERISLLNGGSHVRNIEMERIMSRNSVFILSTLHTEEAQSVYMESLLRKIYARMLAGKVEKPTYIVIDEARKISESRALCRIAAEGRKYKVGVITISQRANEIDPDVMGNCSLIVSFYQREPSELNYMSNYIAGGNEFGRLMQVKKGIRNLSVGEAIMLDSSQREPFIAKFALCRTDATSLKYHITECSLSGVRESDLIGRSIAMGFSREKTLEAIESLISEKRLFRHEIKEGRFRGAWLISEPRNSAEHDLYVNLISRRLSESGIRNEIYNSSYGPDVIAYSNSRRIAIEYETGRKNEEETRRMLLSRRGRYDVVVAVVNDAHYARYQGIEGIRVIRLSSFLEVGSEDEAPKLY